MISTVNLISHRWPRMLVVLAVALAVLAALFTQPASAAAQPVEPTFEIAPGVSAHDAGFAIEGIRLAQDFIVERLNADIFLPLHVTVLPTADEDAPSRIAVANRDRITVYTGSRGWEETSPALRYAVIAHEYTHFYQYLLLQEHNFDSPAWFDEGVAEYLSTLAMSEWGVIERADVETYYGAILSLAAPTETLDELEDWSVYQSSDGAVYPFSYFAVAALFPDPSDLSPLTTAYTLMGAGQPFDTAFSVAFGFTPDEHYARLAENLGAPATSFDISNDILIHIPIERVTNFDATQVPVGLTAGQQVIIEGKAMPASVCSVDLVDISTGETIVERITFADGTGDVFWFVTVPDGTNGTLISVEMACGGDPIERVAVLAA